MTAKVRYCVYAWKPGGTMSIEDERLFQTTVEMKTLPQPETDLVVHGRSFFVRQVTGDAEGVVVDLDGMAIGWNDTARRRAEMNKWTRQLLEDGWERIR